MQSVTAFVRLARPKFLLGGAAAFGLGTAVAASEGRTIGTAAYLVGQTMITAFQLMTHFANDYYDRHADAHTQPTAFAGGSGVLPSGALAPRTALAASLACAAVGIAAAATFGANRNLVAAGLGVAIGLLAWCYSAPPARLAARGWGEANTALVVALLVPLAGYAAATHGVDRLAFAATAAPICAMFAMMIGVEWPDRGADAVTGKRNLVVRLGTGGAGTIAAAAATVLPAAMAGSAGYGAPRSIVVFAVLLAPLALGYARRIRSAGSPAGDIAAHGVTLFFVTVLFSLLAYLAVLR